MKKTPQTKDLCLLPCEHLRGVGKRTADRLQQMGIHHVQDLLFHLPLRYQDRTRVQMMRALSPGDHAVVEGTIDSVAQPKVGRTRLLIRLRDATGHLSVRFFYVNAQQRNTLKPGAQLRCFGETRMGTHGLEMIHPEYHLLTPDIPLPIEDTLTPIYPATEGVSQMMLRKLTRDALQLLAQQGILQDVLPQSILQTRHFPSLKEALHFVHRPPAHAPVNQLLAGQHISQKRLVFEELLAHRLGLLQVKKNFQTREAIPFKPPGKLLTDFIQSLPFQLTGAQQQVASTLAHDLQKSQPMLRLVQGDVGSGKTVVAACAILQAYESGYQTAVLAPTELLVEQHFQTFKQWLEPLHIQVVMLSGQMKTAARREALAAIANHTAHVIIGTHAIFQKDVTFANMALLVVDEQHRFGVEQRAALREKGVQAMRCPHQLIMTATPIPRTLAMSVYADLDYSVIDELPKGRTPVTTGVISNTKRDEVLVRIRQACASGRQAYWVCTLIEESDVLQCKAAENIFSELRIALPELNIGLLHGRMKSHEKEAIMQSFKTGELHLLVATTVIEVGVDVPNASLMIIDNAERLGLAQLHQLRGRVGRGAIASHCLLMYQLPLSHLAKARLAIMRETTDGFRIAERDLELRGPGEVLGTKQTGDVSLRIADLVRDSDLLPAVTEAATVLQQEYPERIEPLIRRWLGNRERFGQV